MKQIKDYSRLLNFLYLNEPLFVEEIAVIENMCRYPDIKAYIDKPDHIASFLLSQYNEDMTWSIFLHSQGNISFLSSALKLFSPIHKLHIQTGSKEKSFILPKLICRHSYKYLMLSLNRADFHETIISSDNSSVIRLHPDMDLHGIEEWFGYGTARLKEEIRHGVYYAIKEGEEWASIAGTQLKSADCYYIFISTEPPFRRKGYAKKVLSAVCGEILRIGKTPVYALDASNLPSVKLAKSLGFKEFAQRECLFAGPWELARPDNDNPDLPDSNYFE
jgi:RimJ/RimL family protein N-acetyltransferase